jgi:hypothetical protein
MKGVITVRFHISARVHLDYTLCVTTPNQMDTHVLSLAITGALSPTEHRSYNGAVPTPSGAAQYNKEAVRKRPSPSNDQRMPD